MFQFLTNIGSKSEKDGTDDVTARDDALGMGNGTVPDSRVSASSWTTASPPKFGRLNSHGSWCARHRSAGSFLEIDLGSMHEIKAVATQGNPAGNFDYVKSYKLQHSRDGKFWFFHLQNGKEIFEGNTDHLNVKLVELQETFKARYVRFWPQEWYFWPCMRVELYGQALLEDLIETEDSGAAVPYENTTGDDRPVSDDRLHDLSGLEYNQNLGLESESKITKEKDEEKIREDVERKMREFETSWKPDRENTKREEGERNQQREEERKKREEEMNKRLEEERKKRKKELQKRIDEEKSKKEEEKRRRTEERKRREQEILTQIEENRKRREEERKNRDEKWTREQEARQKWELENRKRKHKEIEQRILDDKEKTKPDTNPKKNDGQRVHMCLEKKQKSELDSANKSVDKGQLV